MFRSVIIPLSVLFCLFAASGCEQRVLRYELASQMTIRVGWNQPVSYQVESVRYGGGSLVVVGRNTQRVDDRRTYSERFEIEIRGITEPGTYAFTRGSGNRAEHYAVVATGWGTGLPSADGESCSTDEYLQDTTVTAAGVVEITSIDDRQVKATVNLKAMTTSLRFSDPPKTRAMTGTMTINLPQ